MRHKNALQFYLINRPLQAESKVDEYCELLEATYEQKKAAEAQLESSMALAREATALQLAKLAEARGEVEALRKAAEQAPPDSTTQEEEAKVQLLLIVILHTANFLSRNFKRTSPPRAAKWRS